MITRARTPAVEQYECDGYVVVPHVLEEALVHEASEHVAWLQRKHPDLRPEQLGHTLMTDDPFWVRLVSDDRLLDLAEEFIGPNIALFASHYICKPPYTGQPVLWHQDGSYWPLDPMEVITFWLAIDASTPQNGCMRVIPRTHRMSLQGLRPNTAIENVLASEMDPALVDETRAVDLTLAPGDVSIHHPNIVHGSNANTSPLRRCGLTIRYIPTSTRILLDRPNTGPLTPEGRHPSAFLLRGQAAPGVNEYNNWPRYVAGKHMPFRGCEHWA